MAPVHESFSARRRAPRGTCDSPSSRRSGPCAGVCQDFAHIMIALVRHLGIPARYVSGYLVPRRLGTVRRERDARLDRSVLPVGGVDWARPDAQRPGRRPPHRRRGRPRLPGRATGPRRLQGRRRQRARRRGLNHQPGLANQPGRPRAVSHVDARPRSNESRLSAEFYHQQQ